MHPRLRRALRRDLDWITLRAIAKDRLRRYPTAEALAADLERAARGEAVEAAPPSRLYRLSRLARRNRAVFIGIAIALLAIVIGAAVGVSQLLNARESERTAQAVNTFLRNDLLAAVAPADSGVPGRGARRGDEGGAQRGLAPHEGDLRDGWNA